MSDNTIIELEKGIKEYKEVLKQCGEDVNCRIYCRIVTNSSEESNVKIDRVAALNDFFSRRH